MNEIDRRGLMILLPGIGYTCDRPLLYYSGKLARALGWEVRPIPFSGFPPKAPGDSGFLRRSAAIALQQTEKALQGIDWPAYGDVLFVSKSIGTVAATAFAGERDISCGHVLFTPLHETFACPVRDAVAFHGTADPWAETDTISSLCEAARVPLYLTPEANHSLETGDVLRDIQILETVMRRVEAFVRARA